MEVHLDSKAKESSSGRALAENRKIEESVRRTREMFLGDYGSAMPIHTESQRLKRGFKIAAEYSQVKEKGAATSSGGTKRSRPATEETALVEADTLSLSKQLVVAQRKRRIKPTWHAPWKLMRVISGHLGWVRCISVDPSNEWFASGSADRTIKIWDMASGQLKLTLTGHISTVMDMKVSERHPYLFSAGQDKTVRCWDLEYNKVIRNYHGHLSGVYCVALHPTIDIMCSGGRDSVVRVWDIRTKSQIRVLGGHKHTVASVCTQATDPQIISGSHDHTIRCWDLAAGKAITTLTHHKKAVRGLAVHPTEHTFVSGAADNLKVWKSPGTFLRNVSGHNAIVNTVAVNNDNVLVSGADNGTLYFWDWKTGYNFQNLRVPPQPGSLDSESGIFQAKFDRTGSRLITCEADKSIKIWKEDETASEETHPINFRPTKRRRQA